MYKKRICHNSTCSDKNWISNIHEFTFKLFFTGPTEHLKYSDLAHRDGNLNDKEKRRI